MWKNNKNQIQIDVNNGNKKVSISVNVWAFDGKTRKQMATESSVTNNMTITLKKPDYIKSSFKVIIEVKIMNNKKEDVTFTIKNVMIGDICGSSDACMGCLTNLPGTFECSPTQCPQVKFFMLISR